MTIPRYLEHNTIEVVCANIPKEKEVIVLYTEKGIDTFYSKMFHAILCLYYVCLPPSYHDSLDKHTKYYQEKYGGLSGRFSTARSLFIQTIVESRSVVGKTPVGGVIGPLMDKAAIFCGVKTLDDGIVKTAKPHKRLELPLFIIHSMDTVLRAVNLYMLCRYGDHEEIKKQNIRLIANVTGAKACNSFRWSLPIFFDVLGTLNSVTSIFMSANSIFKLFAKDKEDKVPRKIKLVLIKKNVYRKAR